MNFGEYVDHKKQLYTQFSKIVASTIEAAINDRTDLTPPLINKYRAKNESSLRIKLETRKLLNSDNIESEIKDLAGCRLVFYTDGDKNAFVNSRILHDIFAVDRTETRLHHPVQGEPSEDRQYRAMHFLVSLSEYSLKKHEYFMFKGLRCEIQIQTLLQHAWAEISHDITYKNNLVPGFGRQFIEATEKRLNAIMTEFLVPAGYQFQKVKNDAFCLERGNEILSRDPITQLQTATNNNVRFELLTSLKEYVLPYYDDVESFYPRLVHTLSKVIQAARQTEIQPVETAMGAFDDKTVFDVTKAVIDVVTYLRYQDISAALAIYCEIFLDADIKEKKLVVNAVEQFAAYNLDAWKRAGPHVQTVLIEELTEFDATQRQTLRPIILKICAKTLESEVSGVSSPSYDKVSFHRGSVKPSDTLKQIRSKAIHILTNLYLEASIEQDKLQVLNCMLNATVLPYQSNYSDDLVSLTLENGHAIVDFLLQQHKDMTFELLQHIEHRFLDLYKQTQSIAETNEAVTQQANALTTSIEAFRDAINKDDAFIRHKTLVGFEAVFAFDWIDGFDFKRTEAYRLENIEDFINQISVDNAEEWLIVIKRCAATKSRDGATFIVFRNFLERLATAHPVIMLGYLANNSQDLVDFLSNILLGLELSVKAERVNVLIEDWIKAGQYLKEISVYLQSAKVTHNHLIAALSRIAIQNGDRIISYEVIATMVARPDLADSSLVDKVFIPAICYLTKFEDTGWVENVWYQRNLSKFVRSLSQTQSQAILDNLVYRTQIDTHVETILIPIADVDYNAVWEFFGARFKRKQILEKDVFYKAIPFTFHSVAPALGKEANRAVDIVRNWYIDNDPMFAFTGGTLLAIVFPDCPEAFQAKLISIIEADGVASFPFVYCILKNYQVTAKIHSVCQDLIDCLPEADKRLDEIKNLLVNTGMVSGEFGWVEDYKQKRNEIANWSSDPRAKVRSFATQYARDLDRRIVFEQKAAEDSLELRKLEWSE